jgi:hypothetical protein
MLSFFFGVSTGQRAALVLHIMTMYNVSRALRMGSQHALHAINGSLMLVFNMINGLNADPPAKPFCRGGTTEVAKTKAAIGIRHLSHLGPRPNQNQNRHKGTFRISHSTSPPCLLSGPRTRQARSPGQ